MELRITKSPGLRNDLLLIIPRVEVADVLFRIAHRADLMALPGLTRHEPAPDPAARERVAACKEPVEAHLRHMLVEGHTLLPRDGRPKRRVVAIGSRNVGNNHGFVAWQRDEAPRLFRVTGDPLCYPAYTCLVRQRDGSVAIRALRVAEDQVLEGDTDITDEVTWCVYGNPVLREGRVVSIEEIIDQFYDIRHVLAFDRNTPAGRRIETEIYQGYPTRFREDALRVWREKGVPRNRFLHNALGLSEDNIIILQREGTIEEVATWLREAGARDGLILDNGASPFCWAWWPYPNGGFIFTAPDYRPNASSVIAFVLNGSAAVDLPGGSVSYSVA